MAGYPYSRGPSTHGPDEIDVTTIPVPADWLADRPAADETSGRLALTGSALDHLVAALAGQRAVGLPKNLSPYAMVALLDAAWVREQPWRELVQSRLQERGRRAGWLPHRDVRQHLDELQQWWDRLWLGPSGNYRLTSEEVTDEMVDGWWAAWTDEQPDRELRILANPGRLSVEQIAQVTRAAIQRLARNPGDRLPDDLIDDVLAEVEAEVTAVPARPEAGDPDASPASVVPDMIDTYLIARQEWGWPAGRSGAWAVGQVVDRHQTLGMAAAARAEGSTAFAARAEWDLEERTRAARMAWEAQDREPWLSADVDVLLAAAPSPDRIPPELAEQARTMSTGDLLVWVDEARHPPERPLLLEFGAARSAAEQIRHHLDEERGVLQGLRGQLAKSGPWWWPGTWRRRADLRARIAERARVVFKLQQRFTEADDRVLESLPGKQQAADKVWEMQRRQTLEQAAAAVQELQLREQGLLDDRVVDPPRYLLEALGPPPPGAASRQTWQAQALQLERARAAGLAIEGTAARAASSAAPPMLSGSDDDRATARAWIAARDAAGWPVDDAVRGYAASGEPPDDLRPTEPTLRFGGMARPALEENGPPAGYVRLYRGEQATTVTNIPEWMQANQGGWFTSDLAMAQGYTQGGRLVAVDVPEHIAEQWRVTEQGRPSAGPRVEYLLPENVARLAVEITPGLPADHQRSGPDLPAHDLGDDLPLD